MKVTVTITAAVSFLSSLLLLPESPLLATVPLLIFLLLCMIAPFCPQWSFFLPIISKSVTGNRGVALTFDDGPDPHSTPVILALLQKHKLQACFFVIGKKAAAHPELIAAIIEQGHSIGNHSWRHDNLLMLRRHKQLLQDIHTTQETLRHLGVIPAVFRPPAGITNPLLQSVLKKEGLTAVTFSCRAFDGGNKDITDLANRILNRLQDGDIILLHDISPAHTAEILIWEQELDSLLASLADRSPECVALETLIGQPVMEKTEKKIGVHHDTCFNTIDTG